MESLPRQRAILRKDFADSDWMEPIDAMMGELYDLATAAPHYDLARAADLDQRITAFIRERKLEKALAPLGGWPRR